jgi:ACT domain-containing protein
MTNTPQPNQIAYITVLGSDQIGIIAQVSGMLAEHQVNILEVSQTILSDVFTMSMRVDTSESSLTIADLATKLEKLGQKLGLQIHLHDAQIIKSMHRL